MKKKHINFVIFLSLALVLLYFTFRNVDFEHVKQGFREVNYWWILVSVLIGIMSHCARAYRWGILIEPIDRTKKVPFSNILSAVFVGYLANTAFPRLGEVVKCGSITKSDGIRFDSLVGTVVVERAFDLLMTLIITLIVVVIKIDVFGRFILDRVLTPIHTKLLAIQPINAILLVLAIVAMVVLFVVVIKRNMLGDKFTTKLKSILNGVGDGLKSIVHTRKLPAFLISTIMLWLCYWFMTWVLFYSTPITQNLTIWDGLFIMIIGTYGMVMPVQGGFGAYHIIVAVALGIFGITYNDGLIFAIISHELQTLLIIVGGLVALIYQFAKQRERRLTK